MKKRIFAFISVLFILFIMTSCKVETNTLSVNYIDTQADVKVNGETIKPTYQKGSILVIQINPKTGYMVENIIINDQEKTIDNSEYIFKIEKDTIIFINMKVDEGYSLEITGNQEFNYQVTDKNEYGKYFKNTPITLSITNPKDFIIEKVLVNDQETTFNDNKVEFTITKDTNVVVNFKSTKVLISEEVLESIQGNVKISGNYQIEYPDYDEIYNNKITTIFAGDKVHQEEYSIDEEKLTYNVTFFNKDGYACISSVNIKNEIENNTSTSLFSDYDNPFIDLKVEDFVYNDDGYYYLQTNLDDTAATITGWDETISEIKVKVENNKVVKIIINTSLQTDDYGDYFMSLYELDVTMHNEVTIPDVVPYEHKKEHDDLKTALDKMGYNYTVNHLDEEPGYEDIEYKSYSLDNIVYCGYVEDGKSEGYLESAGYVYDFVYDGTTVTVGSALDFESFKDIQSDFKAFAPEIFEYKGDGRYVLTNDDLIPEVAYSIGYSYDVKRLGEYATSFEIIIKDGILYQIKYDYYVYGVDGTVTLTYSDINTTVCPIKLDNIEQITIFDLYTGIYVSEDDAHTVVIAENLIKIDNVEMTIEGFDTSQNMFYGTYNEKDAYVMQYFGKSELWIEYGETYFIVSNENLYKEITAPTEYYGTFKSEDHTIVVSAEGITFDNKKVDLLYYEYITGVVCSLDGVKYYFFVDVDEDDNIICYFVRPDLETGYVLDYVEETE